MTMFKKPRILAILTLFSLFWLFCDSPKPVQAQAGTAAEMLAEINYYRSVNGLPPLEENYYLNLAAQGHADWIAETLQGGHTGEGGSTATDRAHAVGYTGAIVTENWARGPGLTVYNCIYVSWNDEAHIDNMLDPNRKEFGAGVALDSQGFTVYVVDFSNYDTNNYQPDPDSPAVTPGGPTVTTAPVINPIITVTPAADGTVIHIVQYGETLYGIAEAYGISLTELLTLNGLTEDSIIYPNEQLLIRQGAGETPTPTENPEEATPTATPTRETTPTLEATPFQETPTPTEQTKGGGNFLTNIFSGDTLWVGIGLVAVSVFGLVLLLIASARLK